MLFNHYSKKEVKQIVRQLMEEYRQRISSQQTRLNELIEKNRELSARLSYYENKESEISDAILTSVEAGKKIEERSAAYVKNQLNGLKILSDRCRALAADLKEKYPDQKDIDDFSEFFSRMDELLEEDNDFSYEFNKGPELDLEALCKELGIEEDSESKEFIIFDDEE